MKSQHQSIKSLPKNPGVYKFIDKKGVVLYVGKATELYSRVRSYFGKDLINTRGPLILDMVTLADRVEFVQTDSVLEALILEAELIKKLQPKYNTKEKDNKSFLCVVITNEVLPKVLLIRKKDIDLKNKQAKIFRGKQIVKIKNVFGPFTNGQQLRDAMKIVRRIFPYYDDSSSKKQNYQFYKQLALIPSSDYKNNLKNLVLFFQGKKKSILQNLKKQMNNFAKQKKFEQAGQVKKQIFALQHINDIALIKDEIVNTSQIQPFRIEAYDIAHMSGKSMVGVMVVVENGQPAKNEYRKFNIRTISGSNDAGALKEVLDRRFNNAWPLPQIIVVDGNEVQINVAKKVLKKFKLQIPVVSVVKDDRHRARAVLGDIKPKPNLNKLILLANSEAHRFAITFHRTKRSSQFLPSNKK